MRQQGILCHIWLRYAKTALRGPLVPALPPRHPARALPCSAPLHTAPPPTGPALRWGLSVGAPLPKAR